MAWVPTVPRQGLKGRVAGCRLQGSAELGVESLCANATDSLLRIVEIGHGSRLADYKPSQPPANLPRRAVLLGQVRSSQIKSCQPALSALGRTDV